MVITSIASLQCGSALSTRLFDQLGVAGTNFLRTLAGALVLCILARPIPGHDRTDRLLLLGFGAIVALTSIAFYSAIDRLPLGIAVTVEFSGPLTVAVLASRRRLDLAWAALAAVGVLLLSGALEGGPVDRVGLAVAFVAAGGWAAYILVGLVLLGQHLGARDAVAVCCVVVASLGAARSLPPVPAEF